ncbi:hypothetical protein pb186bvf_016279 [Paramecium bursaria]
MIIQIIQAVLAASIGVFLEAALGGLLTRQKIINQDFTKQLSGLIERVFIPALMFSSFLKATTSDQLLSLVPVFLITFLCVILGYLIGLLSIKWIQAPNLKQIILLASSNPHTTNIQLQLSFGLSSFLNLRYNIQDAEIQLLTTIMIQTVIINSLRFSIGKAILMQYSNEVRDQEMETPQEMLLRPQKIKKQEPEEHSFFNVPIMSVIAAFICILISPIQQQLINDTFLHNAIFVPITTLGRAAPPCVLIILGSNLQMILSNGLSSNIDHKHIMYITGNRLIISPLVGLIVTWIFKSILNPCQSFVIFITFCTPSAINILVMAKQYTNNTEEIVSLILLYGYLGCVITLPIWMIIFLI